jgi:hypothetical protein
VEEPFRPTENEVAQEPVSDASVASDLAVEPVCHASATPEVVDIPSSKFKVEEYVCLGKASFIDSSHSSEADECLGRLSEGGRIFFIDGRLAVLEKLQNVWDCNSYRIMIGFVLAVLLCKY